MSSALGPPSRDASASTRKGPTRKAPPSPLAISSSASRLQPPSINTDSVSPAASSSNTPSSSNNTGRNSIDSSRSDLASARSELTSLHVSEFPLPPTALPTIPASPRTPRSLTFSTTPRSQSPISGFAYQQEDSPRNLGPNERAGSRSPVAAPLHHGYDLPRDPGPARYSQYAIYKESNTAANASRPATPTTAGTITSRDWPTSSEQRSSLQPPRPVYATVETPPLRSGSPLRNTTFANQQDRQHPRDSPRNESPQPPRSTSPHPPRSTSPQPPRSSSPQPPRSSSPQPPRSSSPQPPRSSSPQPPRSPLPVPPQPRDSTRYSHIARRAGVTDMGLDISEEDLLSTDFISELLNQPAVSSPRSARFLRLPDSPQSPSFSNIALEETSGLSGIVGANEMRLAPGRPSALDSPRFSGPMSVSTSDAGMASPVRYSDERPDVKVTGRESPTSLSGDGTDWHRTKTRRMQSGLASSVYPSGGDRIDETSPATPSFPMSPNAQSLTVPENKLRSHASPHPLMPSTPMSRESFASAMSPRSPQGFAQAQAQHSTVGQWRNTSTSQSLAAHLPIGGRSPSSPAHGPVHGSTSPRIRQHHYPRHGPAKGVAVQNGQAQDNTPLKSMTYPPQPVNLVQPPTTGLLDKVQNASDASAQARAAMDSTNVTSPAPSAMSFSSSTRTQRDSTPASSRAVPMSDSLENLSEEPIPTMPIMPINLRRSLESSYPSSTDHGVDDDDSMEGEIQTASRVWGATSPVGIEARPTIIGIAPAVILNHNASEHREAASTDDPQAALYANHHPFDSYGEATPPASPRDPPSIHSPPAHRTDMPESVKSLGLTEDVHGAKNLDHRQHEEVAYRMPYDEIAGYGSPNFLGYQGSPSSLQSPRSPLDRRPSNQASSFKSVVSYITSKSRASTVASRVSKVSNKSTASSRWAWLKRKPLPPLPTSAESEDSHDESRDLTYPTSLHRHEAGLQLPDLAQRAGNVKVMLDRGSYARGSKLTAPLPGEPQGWSDHSVSVAEKGGNWHEEPPIVKPLGLRFADSGGKFEMLAEDSLKVAKKNENKRRKGWKQTGSPDYGSKDFNTISSHDNQRQEKPARFVGLGKPRGRMWMWLPLVAVIIVVIIISIALATTLGRRHASTATASKCNGNTAGFRCNLDATCTCPASQSNTCSAPLAQALVDLVPIASQLFATNITTNAMAVVLWEAQGTPAGQNCASQTTLVDVGSVLDSATLPNRTQWAQAALLWSLFQSGDIPAIQDMQSAVEKLPFQSLPKDGPQPDSSDKFAVSSSGYKFNFASQTVEAPPLKFQDNASPSPAQLGELNSAAQSSLDRMYSFAGASSTQRQTALSTYWESVLSLNRNDLPAFVSAFKAAPVLLPFDVMASPGGQAISELLTAATNRTLSFPPSIGCFPGLSTSQIQRISTVETQVFGLPAISSSPSTFDSSCFPNRPVYGILDVLRTRLPFSDFRAGVAKQAATLSSDASLRAVLGVGELLSALPADAANGTNLTPFTLNPRQFGTLSHVNHIALNWLQAFPTVAVAADAAKFVLSSPSSPPPPNSTLFNSTSIPVVEAAVFGNIFLPDLGAFASSFSTPSGGLFFGSSQGDSFRRWALQNSSQAIITWSATNFAQQTVQERSSPDPGFERIWSGAASLISNAPGGVTGPSDVSQVTTAFFQGPS